MINNSLRFDSESESDSLMISSDKTSEQIPSQTSEQQREQTKQFLQEFFTISTDETSKSMPKYCWLETISRPPVRQRKTNVLHQKISTQIICQDIEDETPFVKLVNTDFHLN